MLTMDAFVRIVLIAVVVLGAICLAVITSQEGPASWEREYAQRVVDVYATCDVDEVPRTFARSKYSITDGRLSILTWQVGEEGLDKVCTFTTGQWCRVEERVEQ